MATFADSTIRKMIFPYLEDSDYEDPDRPSHWLSNITPQALGLDNRRNASTKRRRRQREGSDSLDVPWSSSFYGSQPSREDDSSDADDHIDNSIVDRSARSADLKQHNKLQRSHDHDESSTSFHAGSQGTLSPARPAYSTQHRSITSVNLPPMSSKRKIYNKGASADKGKNASGEAKCSDKSKSRRHQRHHSLPTPLTPAQPLGQVNTFLPLRLPPPDLRAKSPLAYPVGCDFPEQHEEKGRGPKFSLASVESTPGHSRHHRRAHTSRLASPLKTQFGADDGWDSTQSSPSSGNTSMQSAESDGSFHGDAGDEDPESQLAAGIARMKATKRAQEDKEEACVAKEQRDIARARAAVPYDDDSVTRQQIQQHAGILTSLAELVLELKINRSGPAFRHRSSSCADVNGLNAQAQPSSGSSLNRTQSADALEGLWTHTRRPSHNSLFSSGMSTPYELRDEVARWSQRRSVPGTPKSATDGRAGTPKLGLLSYLPFASAVRTRLAQLQRIVTIAEASEDSAAENDNENDDDDEEQLVDQAYADTLAFAAAAAQSKHQSHRMEASQDQGDDEGELSYSSTNEDDALSSLWASPVTSRASSHYNLKLLSDEPCAFEEPGTSIDSGPRRPRLGDASMLRFTQLNAGLASKPVRSRRGASSATTVSPLWDQKQTDGGDSNSESSLRPPAYTRSWSSILGMAA